MQMSKRVVVEDVYNGNKPSMKLQLVSFEQAKALKDLGFPQLYEYTLDNKGNRKLKLAEYLVPYAFDEQGNATVDRWNTKTYSCIPLEFVAKWLRDEKNLWIEISKGGYEKSAHCFLGDYIYEDATHIKEFNSYEEALSAGIDKAIEILKKNDND